MIEYYDQLKEPIAKTACIVGDFYAIFEDNNWHRVQCIDFDLDTGNAMVHFIDEGYEDEYNCELLHPLDKRFCDLQAQVRSSICYLSTRLNSLTVVRVSFYFIGNQGGSSRFRRFLRLY